MVSKNIDKVVLVTAEALVIVIILLAVFTQLVPEAQSAGDELESTGVPLGALFAGSGAILLLIMVGLVLFMISLAISPPGRK